jgi:hypothetical protein
MLKLDLLIHVWPLGSDPVDRILGWVTSDVALDEFCIVESSELVCMMKCHVQ